MDIQQYTKWKDTRGEAGDWKIEDCRAADTLIKTKTMENVDAWARRNILNTTASEFFINAVRAHLGSADVDEMLTKLKLYPEWI